MTKAIDLCIVNGSQGRAAGSGLGSGSGRWLSGKLARVLGILGVARATWNVKLVADAEMALMHKRTLQLDTTTDVLTFDMRSPAEQKAAKTRAQQPAVDLETMVCVDEARRRASEFGHDLREELLLYCVHSLLHVVGYDDRTAGAARRMHAREDEILLALGIGTIFRGKSLTARYKIVAPHRRRRAAGRPRFRALSRKRGS